MTDRSRVSTRFSADDVALFSGPRSSGATLAAEPARRMRVLMVTPRFLPEVGGVENHVDQVSRRLARDVDVTVLTTDREGTLPAEEQLGDVPVLRVPAWPRDHDWRYAPRLRRVIEDGDWDVVHVQSYHTAVAPLAMLAAGRAGIPYVVTFHGGGHSSRLRNLVRGPQWRALRPLLAGADRLVAVATFEVALYSQRLGVPPALFAVVPNGCDLPDPGAVPVGERRVQRRVIASVGRLERYKGHQRVVEALPYILAEEPDVELRVVGSGPYRDGIERTAERCGVRERVTVGSIPAADRLAMASAMKGFDVVVLMSDFETHPLTVIEAASLGRPCVVADNSGLRELAERGLASAIPTDSGPRAIADAVLAQLRHPMEIPAVGLPSWDDCAAGLLEVYRGVVGTGSADR